MNLNLPFKYILRRFEVVSDVCRENATTEQIQEQQTRVIVPNDSKLVKVSSPALGAEGLLECDDDGCYVVSVPDGTEQPVTKPGMREENIKQSWLCLL